MDRDKELETAKKRAMYLLGGKDYSRKELMTKLLKNYSRETCEKAVEQMVEYGFLDDSRYAQKLARHYIEVKKYGKSRAKSLMIQKGLGSSTADEALEQYSAEDLADEIVTIIKKKYMDRIFAEGPDARAEVQKVIAALARRGYRYEQIMSAMKTVRDMDYSDDCDFSESDW